MALTHFGHCLLIITLHVHTRVHFVSVKAEERPIFLILITQNFCFLLQDYVFNLDKVILQTPVETAMWFFFDRTPYAVTIWDFSTSNPCPNTNIPSDTYCRKGQTNTVSSKGISDSYYKTSQHHDPPSLLWQIVKDRDWIFIPWLLCRKGCETQSNDSMVIYSYKC